MNTFNQKEWNNANKDKRALYYKNWIEKNKIKGWCVYLLPAHDYVGVSSQPLNRMRYHRTRGRSTNGWRILHYAPNKTEAMKLEVLYVDLYGYTNKR